MAASTHSPVDSAFSEDIYCRDDLGCVLGLHNTVRTQVLRHRKVRGVPRLVCRRIGPKDAETSRLEGIALAKKKRLETLLNAE